MTRQKLPPKYRPLREPSDPQWPEDPNDKDGCMVLIIASAVLFIVALIIVLVIVSITGR